MHLRRAMGFDIAAGGLLALYILFVCWLLVSRSQPVLAGSGHGLVFVPFGMYLSMLLRTRRLRTKLPAILLAALALELLLQRVAPGHSIVPGLLWDVLGGVLGLGLFDLGALVFRSRELTMRVYTVLAASATGLLAFSLILAQLLKA